MIDDDTIIAIKAYQEEISAKDSDIMFEPGAGRNPANKWTQMLRKFFKKHGHEVKSHDFRVTKATDYYNDCTDVVKVQRFLGHAQVSTTQGYVKMSIEELDKTTHEHLNKRKAQKRQRTEVMK